MNRLRIGVALYNAGRYLAAHEPLEELWLDAPTGERDDCLQGLIQASAAVYKARRGNDAGAAGLAESASEYINDCSTVDAEALRPWLSEVAVDPAVARDTEPPELRLDGRATGIYDLSPSEVVAAGEAVAEAEEDELIKSATKYVELDLEDGAATSPFVTLTLDYISDPTPIVRQRLTEHVERREMRESDVEGLF